MKNATTRSCRLAALALALVATSAGAGVELSAACQFQEGARNEQSARIAVARNRARADVVAGRHCQQQSGSGNVQLSEIGVASSVPGAEPTSAVVNAKSIQQIQTGSGHRQRIRMGVHTVPPEDQP